jgi:splicing factor 3B subunit 4
MYAREERNQDATVYVGELDSRVSEALLWELMLQSGPVGKSSSSLPPRFHSFCAVLLPIRNISLI